MRGPGAKLDPDPKLVSDTMTGNSLMKEKQF